jgi:hypothetical protein
VSEGTAGMVWKGGAGAPFIFKNDCARSLDLTLSFSLLREFCTTQPTPRLEKLDPEAQSELRTEAEVLPTPRLNSSQGRSWHAATSTPSVRIAQPYAARSDQDTSSGQWPDVARYKSYSLRGRCPEEQISRTFTGIPRAYRSASVPDGDRAGLICRWPKESITQRLAE